MTRAKINNNALASGGRKWKGEEDDRTDALWEKKVGRLHKRMIEWFSNERKERARENVHIETCIERVTRLFFSRVDKGMEVQFCHVRKERERRTRPENRGVSIGLLPLGEANGGEGFVAARKKKKVTL